MNLNIVLVEPEIPQNTGNIARTCAATGSRLHLVRPMGFTVTDRHLKRAGMDYWYEIDITYYDSLDHFMSRNAGAPMFFLTTKGKQTHTEVRYPNNAFLVFGKESAGLPEGLLAAQDPRSLIRIPMAGRIRSLNLSTAAGVVIYETLRQWEFPELEKTGWLRSEKPDPFPPKSPS